jgi:hypothetical protein
VCSDLAADGGWLGQRLASAARLGPADDALAAKVLAEVQRDRAPSWRSGGRQLLVWAAFFGVVALGTTHQGLRYGAPLLLGAAAGAAATVLRPLHRPAAGAAPARVVGALALPLAVALYPMGGGPMDAAWLAATAGCFAWGAVTSLAVWAVIRATERRRRPSLGWVVASVAFAALAGGTVLELSCPVPHVAHRLLGHGAIGLVGAVVVGSLAAARQALGGR